MQYVADEDAYAYVEAGDLKLDRRLTHTGHFEFPLAHYHGAMICFDLETADAGLAAQMKGFPVSAADIRQSSIFSVNFMRFRSRSEFRISS